MKASLDDHDYEPGIIRSFCLGFLFTYTRYSRQETTGMGTRIGKSRVSLQNEHLTTRKIPKTSIQSICVSTLVYLHLWDILYVV